MSLALGPIHHWIFNQLCLVEGRGDVLAEALIAEHGESADAAWTAILAAHPGRYTGQALEGLVEGGQIHQSLEAMIATVQAREAALVVWAHEHDSMEILRRAYAGHGAEWGARMQEAAEPKDAPAVFAALRELWLEGMPCDIRVELVEDSTDRLRWAVPELSLARYWEGSNCSPELMLDLHGLWMASFVETSSEGFAWSMPASVYAGADRIEFEIAQS
jgi:hypothetical protein